MTGARLEARLRRAARHEAGHAVMLYERGYGFEKAWIHREPVRSADGRTSLGGVAGATMETPCIIMAGMAAEVLSWKRVPKKLPRWFWFSQASGDVKDLEKYLPNADALSDRVRWVDEVWSATLDRCRQWRPQIEAVAEALLERESLAHEEICAVIEAAGTPRRGGKNAKDLE